MRDARLFVVLLLVASISACTPAMSVEEAKQVTARFGRSAFVPPPRTIEDITAILDQQKQAETPAVLKLRSQADQPPPQVKDRAALATFYFDRGMAAKDLGRTRQAVEDLNRAVELGGGSNQWLFELALAEIWGGNFSRAIDLFQQILGGLGSFERGLAISINANLARMHAWSGALEAAEAALSASRAIYSESRSWQVDAYTRAAWEFTSSMGQAGVAEYRGRYAEAERAYRAAIAAAAGVSPHRADNREYSRAKLAGLLVKQGRLLEAEQEARTALLTALRRTGRNSSIVATVLTDLVGVLMEQGRFVEAERLARAAIETFEKLGVSRDSLFMGVARLRLGSALVAQGRWREAVAEYDLLRARMTGDSATYERITAGDPDRALALLETGAVDQALEQLTIARTRAERSLGAEHPKAAEARGLRAMALTLKDDRAAALGEFRAASRLLLNRSLEVDEEGAARPARDQRLTLILTRYIALLADVRGTPLEAEVGDAAAEAFRLAEVARARTVQRAIDASAARAAARTPALADLVRREQDAKMQVSALLGALANLLALPTDRQDPRTVASLRTQIETLRRARQTLAQQIEREFPAYAQLINPAPATIADARSVLRPGEALLSTYVADGRTFVWAVPHRGEVAFAAVPTGTADVRAAVVSLRRALEPDARTLGDIPAFDVAAAHRLYRDLLAPVARGWREAKDLLIVAHGPLGELPFGLLVTAPTELAAETDPLFNRYRRVPWLVRTHSVTVLPSVTALRTLRALPGGPSDRRSFAGFGDPYFSAEQARLGVRPPAAPEGAVASRAMPIALRDLRIQNAASARLSVLPRLPDTAEEIRSIATTLNADLGRDVFLGERANEQTVKTADLAGYRVLAFATHGLAAGDLDGLTQPALALSAPEVARIEGDGLLTMEEILGLRLNADWVVLSACNTASGQGVGAEAISGLGRAFFYAGARALLVSNWPVETTSARALTVELFRRQAEDRSLDRARALQQAMFRLIDGAGHTDPRTGRMVFSYAHPLFWAPFSLVGDGGGQAR